MEHQEEITSENALQVLNELRNDMKEVRAELNKYKGFAGGIWFVLSCIGIFIGAFRFFHRS